MSEFPRYHLARNSLYAAITAASSGNNTIIAAVANKVIRVPQGMLSVHADVNAAWLSSGGTVIQGAAKFLSGGGAVYGPGDAAWFKTLKGEGLVLNLSGAVQCGGGLVYILTDD